MPRKQTIRKARQDKREGKSPSTQAGEFVHEEIDKIRRGKHGARSTKQAIAIGLSEARRAGVDLPPPRKGRMKQSTRRSAEYAYEAGQGKRKTRRRPRVSRAVKQVLKKEPRSTASHRALAAGQAGRSPPQRGISFRRGPEGIPHKGCKGSLRSRKEGRPHQSAPPALTAFVYPLGRTISNCATHAPISRCDGGACRLAISRSGCGSELSHRSVWFSGSPAK